MALALIPKRCEVVAAFTNPTLHRTISQHFLFLMEAQQPMALGNHPYIIEMP